MTPQLETQVKLDTPVALIWAMAENRVIGIDNKLPWYLPKDLQFFKQCTWAKPVIMGRKTHESIGRPLPGRTNIVISRQPGYTAAGCRVTASLEAALELADQCCLIDGGEEIIVMGGAQIYQQALPYANKLYITRVHANIEGDAFFPEYDESQWQEVSRQECQKEGSGEYDYGFFIYHPIG